jgi:hypothetical protein
MRAIVEPAVTADSTLATVNHGMTWRAVPFSIFGHRPSGGYKRGRGSVDERGDENGGRWEGLTAHETR